MTETTQGGGNFQSSDQDRKKGHFVSNGEPRCFPNPAGRRTREPMGKTMGIGDARDDADRIGPMVGRPDVDDLQPPGSHSTPREPSGWDPDLIG